MKTGTKAGLLFSIFGCVAGSYYGLSPIYSLLQSGALSGQEAGLMFGSTGLAIGCILGATGFLSSSRNAI